MIKFATPRGAEVAISVNADRDRLDVTVDASGKTHKITTRHVGLGSTISDGERVDCLNTGGTLPPIGLDVETKNNRGRYEMPRYAARTR